MCSDDTSDLSTDSESSRAVGGAIECSYGGIIIIIIIIIIRADDCGDNRVSYYYCVICIACSIVGESKC